jgi:hypothetical protein
MLRRRPPNWLVWVWLPPALVNLVASARMLGDDVIHAAVPGIAGFFLLFLSRYFFEHQQVFDRLSRLESENAALREQLGKG